MDEIIYYSAKFPKISEHRINYYSPSLLIATILITAMLFYRYKEVNFHSLINVLLLCPTIYLAVLISEIIYKTHVLIGKIVETCEDNSNVSKKAEKYKNHLLLCDVNFSTQRKRFKNLIIIFVITLVSFFVFTKYFIIDNRYVFYFTWMFYFIITTAFYFVALNNISQFFFDLTDSCQRVILKDKDFTELVFKKNIITTCKIYLHKWRKLFIFALLILSLMTITSFFFSDFQRIGRSSSLLIGLISIFIIVRDINKIINTNLSIIGEYDEYIKAKLGMIFKQK